MAQIKHSILFILLIALFAVGGACANENIKGPYLGLGVTAGGIKANFGYRYQLFPGSVVDIIAFGEVIGVKYSDSLVFSLTPGFYFIGFNGNYYGIGAEYFVKDMSPKMGYTFFSGKELLTNNDKNIFLETGYHLFGYSQYWYFDIGFKWNTLRCY